MNDMPQNIPPPEQAGTSAVASKESIIEVLQAIEDPELFLDIWFLGLIYSIEVEGAAVKIDMTFTSAVCPAGPMLIEKVKTGVGALPGVSSVEVKVVFSPPWKPSDEVRALLGLL